MAALTETANGSGSLDVAFVTGAGSGIGEAAARRLAADGFFVVVADVDLDAADAVANSLGGHALAQRVDVSQEDDVARAVEQAAMGGRLRAVVNSAGVGLAASATSTQRSDWDRVFAVNATGTFLVCKHAAPLMIGTEGASIVNVASIAGLVGLRNRAAYCASKGAVLAFTRALALELVGNGVRVNAVCPGTVGSPWVRRLVEDSGEDLEALRARQPMGRLGTPEEVADAIAFLAGPESSFATGSSLVLDGGITAA